MTGTAATRIGGVQAANEAHATTPEAPAAPARACGRWSAPATAPPSSRRPRTGWRWDGSRPSPTTSPILTNLTHEHLELHGTWEAYRDAKLRLFERLAPHVDKPLGWPATGIVNADDPTAGAFIGVAQEAGRPDPDVRHGSGGRRPGDPRRGGPAAPPDRLRRPVRELRRSTSASSAGSTSTTRSRSSRSARRSASTRRPSATGLASVPVVPGRMERVDLGQPFGVDRRLRAQSGVAPDRPRPPRAAGGVARRGTHRGLRVGRRARHGQAPADGPDRRRACPDRRR